MSFYNWCASVLVPGLGLDDFEATATARVYRIKTQASAATYSERMQCALPGIQYANTMCNLKCAEQPPIWGAPLHRPAVWKAPSVLSSLGHELPLPLCSTVLLWSVLEWLLERGTQEANI